MTEGIRMITLQFFQGLRISRVLLKVFQSKELHLYLMNFSQGFDYTCKFSPCKTEVGGLPWVLGKPGPCSEHQESIGYRERERACLKIVTNLGFYNIGYVEHFLLNEVQLIWSLK